MPLPQVPSVTSCRPAAALQQRPQPQRLRRLLAAWYPGALPAQAVRRVSPWRAAERLCECAQPAPAHTSHDRHGQCQRCVPSLADAPAAPGCQVRKPGLCAAVATALNGGNANAAASGAHIPVPASARPLPLPEVQHAAQRLPLAAAARVQGPPRPPPQPRRTPRVRLPAAPASRNPGAGAETPSCPQRPTRAPMAPSPPATPQRWRKPLPARSTQQPRHVTSPCRPAASASLVPLHWDADARCARRPLLRQSSVRACCSLTRACTADHLPVCPPALLTGAACSRGAQGEGRGSGHRQGRGPNCAHRASAESG